MTPGDIPGPIIASESVKTSATATTETKGDAPPITTSGPSIVLTTNDLTGEKIAAVQQGATTTVVGTSKDAGPVSVSNVDVKELAKEVAREMSELETAKSSQAGEKTIEGTVSTKSDSDKLLESAAAKLEADIENSAASHEAVVSASLRTRLTKLRNTQVEHHEEPEIEEAKPANIKSEVEQAAEEEAPILLQLGLVHPNNPEISVPDASVPLESKRTETKPVGSQTAPQAIKEEFGDAVKASEHEPSSSSASSTEISEPAIVPQTDMNEPVPNPDTLKSEENQDSIQIVEDRREAEATSPEPTKPAIDVGEDKAIPIEIASGSPTSQGVRDSNEASHAVTQAAVQEAHVKIAALHTSNELLHQSMYPLVIQSRPH